MQEEILTYFSTVFSILFLILLFGIIMDFLERLTLSYGVSMFGKKVMIFLSAYIGTPIHELGHLLFAVIFGHTITSVQLIPTRKSLEQGYLGCVNHTYNKQNFYQKFGNFFIGIGPMFSGPIVILIILKLLLPETYNVLYSQMIEIIQTNESALGTFLMMVKAIFGMFTLSNLGNFKFYIFLFLSTNIAAHMGLSFEDVKHSVFSLIFLLVIIIIVAFMIPAFPGINISLVTIYSFLSAIFSLSIILSLISFLFFRTLYIISH